MHTVIAATGGMAAIAAPIMGPVGDLTMSTFGEQAFSYLDKMSLTCDLKGDTILVEVGLHAGFDLTTTVANDLIIGHGVSSAIPLHSKRLETTGVKTLLITLKYKHTIEDASLGFYRSSLHA